MKSACELIPADAVRAFRCLVGLDDTGGFADLAALERLDHFWDTLAGPYALTGEEKKTMRACRERFGFYDPTNLEQVAFLEDRPAPVIPSPREEFWELFLKRWRAA